MEYRKIQSVSKSVLTRGPNLKKLILNTMKTCADIVGATLGPGGMPVIIERQENRLPPIVTKDGVTVFKSLGFEDPAAQVLMETGRDAAVRTAVVAGDGTSNSTILSEAFVRYTMDFCENNPKFSPQRVTRLLEETFKTVIDPAIQNWTIRPEMGTEEGRKILHSVAQISANGDTALADAVLSCFDTVGDEGNITLTEESGPSEYLVEKIEGYTIDMGLDDTCGLFMDKFINDQAAQSCILDNPVFLLYNGRLNDFQSIMEAINQVILGANEKKCSPNLIIIAKDFSESVMANLAVNFTAAGSINTVPIKTPLGLMKNLPTHILLDVAAVTGATIFDQLTNPLQNCTFEDLGHGPSRVEIGKLKSIIVGYREEELLLIRDEELASHIANASSELESNLLKERRARLSSGIANLKIVGSSNGEVKEKKDRAEDAVCAVRGAIKHGALPGGGFTLAHLSRLVKTTDFANEEQKIVCEKILAPALLEPIKRLFKNAGYNDDEVEENIQTLLNGQWRKTFNREEPHLMLSVVDVLNRKVVDAIEGGILDSTPAVREAIKNSLSIASLMGTNGGIVCFQRDSDLERAEALENYQFIRDVEEGAKEL